MSHTKSFLTLTIIFVFSICFDTATAQLAEFDRSDFSLNFDTMFGAFENMENVENFENNENTENLENIENFEEQVLQEEELHLGENINEETEILVVTIPIKVIPENNEEQNFSEEEPLLAEGTFGEAFIPELPVPEEFPMPIPQETFLPHASACEIIQTNCRTVRGRQVCDSMQVCD